MGTYAVTGSASGMGRITADKLRAEGHVVIGVDIEASEVTADLSTPQGRRHAAEAALTAADGHLDGAVLAAGLGPTPGARHMIPQVNYLGVVELLRAWRPALAAAGNAKVVVFSSNSTTTTPLVPRRASRALLDGNPDRALRATRLFGPAAPAMIYAASKIAVSNWVRRHAVQPAWIGAGIRLNAIAPGAILTPLLQRQLANPTEAKAVRMFPVPAGDYGDAAQLGDWVLFMLSETADFLVGSVIFVDGGSDAYFRADSWPRTVPMRELLSYIRRMRSFTPARAQSRTR